MAVNPQAQAGTYYSELDLSQIIAGVATAIGAVVGAASRGPVYPQLITTATNYIKQYGKPDATLSFLGYTSTAFLTQSNMLWVRRVVGAGATWGGWSMQLNSDGSTKLVPTAAPDPDTNGVDFTTIGGGTLSTNVAYFYPLGPGAYASKNIQIEIVSTNLTAPENLTAANFATVGVIIAGQSAAGTLPSGNYSYVVTALNKAGETTQSNVATVTLPGNVAAYLTWTQETGALGYNVYRLNTISTKYEYVATVGAGFGYYVDNGSVAPSASQNPPTAGATSPQFSINVYDTAQSLNVPVEQWPVALTVMNDGNGNQLELTQVINNQSQYIRVLSNVASLLTIPPIYSVAKTFGATASDGSAPLASDVTTAWQDFADPENVDVRILINNGYATPSVQLAMDTIAQTRADCIAVLDVPSNMQSSGQQVANYRNLNLNLDSSFSALYASDVQIQDQYTNSILYVPPSGFVAAQYAYTDSVAYPWFAPAGANRGKIKALGLRTKFDSGERDLLSQNQINVIRSIKGIGNSVIWDQWTLQSQLSALSFVNVRRMLISIKLSVEGFLLGKDFDPNDDFLRTQIVTGINGYLKTVKQARGLQQYLVECDLNNNSQLNIGQGQLHVDLYLTPTIAVRQFLVRSIITAQGVNFADIQALVNNG
jgi:phage tail sheath protein FI